MRFLDLVVDGAPLSRFAVDRVTQLGGSEAERSQVIAQLTGDAPGDIGDRVALYVCPVCGDLDCGAVTVRVHQQDELVLWTDLRFSYRDSDS